METTRTQSGLDLDTKALSEFIYALNTARRQVLAYPQGHPVIAAAADRLVTMLPRIFEFRSELTIGIARDTLLVGAEALDSKNPIYTDFAKNLFKARVASLTVSSIAAAEDFCRFFELLRRDPEDVADHGGLERLMQASGINGLRAQGVDFSAFHATEVDQVHKPKSKLVEEETTLLWKSFVNGLVAGTLDPDGDKSAPGMQFDPKLLAEVMNRGDIADGETLADSYEDAITRFLKDSDREHLRSQASQVTLDRLGDLVANLKPELRRRFLNSTLKSCSNSHDKAAEVLGHLPQAQILEAMEQVDTERLEVPQTLMDVLGKLAQQHDGSARSSLVAGKREHDSGQTAELLQQLFSADKSSQFVPEDYQDALAVLAAAEHLPGLDREQVDELVETLDGHSVEKQFCNVMVDLLDKGSAVRAGEAITRNMEELILYFLEVGDFVSLNSVYDHLSQHAGQSDELLDPPDKTALRIFDTDDFVADVLDGLDTWGKAQYPGIKGLIKRVGSPFAEPLLDCLVDEPQMSRRKLYMECLHLIGPGARDAMIERLHDRRWFFVRNLVVLLRGLDDQTVLQPLGRLVGYAHPKVQFEVMRTFIHYKDPRADRYLLKELESRDPQVLLNTARLAANSHNSDVAVKLAELLTARLSSDEEVKKAIVKALDEMACPEALPGLGAFLHSRGLLAGAHVNRLKVEVVRSLLKYDEPHAADLAEEVHRKYSGELARVAGEVCLKKGRKLAWS